MTIDELNEQRLGEIGRAQAAIHEGLKRLALSEAITAQIEASIRAAGGLPANLTVSAFRDRIGDAIAAAFASYVRPVTTPNAQLGADWAAAEREATARAVAKAT